MYAMKKFHSGKRETFLHEKNFAQLENPHVVTAVGCSTGNSKEDFLLFPFSENGTLKGRTFISNNIQFIIISWRLAHWRVKASVSKRK